MSFYNVSIGFLGVVGMVLVCFFCVPYRKGLLGPILFGLLQDSGQVDLEIKGRSSNTPLKSNHNACTSGTFSHIHFSQPPSHRVFPCTSAHQVDSVPDGVGISPMRGRVLPEGRAEIDVHVLLDRRAVVDGSHRSLVSWVLREAWIWQAQRRNPCCRFSCSLHFAGFWLALQNAFGVWSTLKRFVPDPNVLGCLRIGTPSTRAFCRKEKTKQSCEACEAHAVGVSSDIEYPWRCLDMKIRGSTLRPCNDGAEISNQISNYSHPCIMKNLQKGLCYHSFCIFFCIGIIFTY